MRGCLNEIAPFSLQNRNLITGRRGYPVSEIPNNMANEKTEKQFPEAMSKASTYYMEDAEIRNVLEEEFLTYGDKDIDEIIAVINDRISKIVSERK